MSPTQQLNRLPAYALSELLDQRKRFNQTDLEKLGQDYGLDAQTVQRLAHVVNSPSIGANSAVTSVDANGDEITTYKVCRWQVTERRKRTLT